MSSFLILSLIAACVAAFIWLLNKNQRRRTLDTVERTAPLPALGKDLVPGFDGTSDAAGNDAAHAGAHGPSPATAGGSVPLGRNDSASTSPGSASSTSFATSAPRLNGSAAAPVADTWLARIKFLREAGDASAALGLCRAYFPRTQALQQAAIILRQQIRDCLDNDQAADGLLTDLFRTAVLADLFRNGNPQKPADAATALASMQKLEFPYPEIGHGQLRLLNKSDVRTLEQAWGRPLAHRHGEEVLATAWLALCGPGQSPQ